MEKKESLEQELDEFRNMTVCLENLKPEIKEQLIGLCLNKKIIENIEDYVKYGDNRAK